MFTIRLIGLAGAAATAWITYNNWMTLAAEGKYDMRAAVLAPTFFLLSLLVVIFPKYFGTPETTKDKIVVMSVFALGVAAGVYNLYMMDPGMFGL